MKRALLSLLVAAGCTQRTAEPLPALPSPQVGRATVSGQVVDANHLPLADVQVVVAESDDTFTTLADGRYTLSVPSSSSVTLRALKPAYANTTLTPLLLDPGQSLEGYDILMVPGPSIGAFNAIAGPSEDRGVLAVNLVSLQGRCSPANATVHLEPVPASVPVYVASGKSQPDRTLAAMQEGSSPNAWVVGVAEGTGYRLVLDKAGCTQLPYPVAFRQATWQPGFRVQPKGLTQVTLFTE